MMKKEAFNPYLPSWEYVPDGEPHVFGDRVYVYGSHDLFNGWVFCLGDYVCYSAPINDLSDWTYEGVIYKKTDDPINNEGKMVLYAPDVTQGPDGRYYIYYVLDKVGIVSVASSDSPAGPFNFYGYVHYENGEKLGERQGDMPQFDPAVITEGDKTYLYTGFCGNGMKDRLGAMAMELGPDMLTVKGNYSVIVPGDCYGKKTSFKDHEFFEASSIRKIGDTYYFVYSSAVMHELCYATSKNPLKDFVYGGVIVSNCDIGIDSYKPADMPAAYGANNHGGIEYINGDWYIFYHRHTNGTWYSRQGCAEKIKILPDGSIPQVQITSCGLNGGPLSGKGYYSAHIVCNMFIPNKPSMYISDQPYPKVTQDGRDGDKEYGYIADVTDQATFGFKYFDFKEIKKITIWTRGYASGCYEVKTQWDGPVLGTIPVSFTNIWEKHSADIEIPDGVSALYLTYKGSGKGQFKGFELS
ncbi:MAG: family 43 glycosylhydrolase [Treponema sp.]|nr:family 43 glycosylhydrolase [Treponema sp.]